MLCLALLAGCAGGGWAKPGASADDARQDLAECQSEARAATRQDTAIDTDILATRSNDWMRNGTLTEKRDSMASASRARGQDVLSRCMAGKGYSPVK